MLLHLAKRLYKALPIVRRCTIDHVARTPAAQQRWIEACLSCARSRSCHASHNLKCATRTSGVCFMLVLRWVKAHPDLDRKKRMQRRTKTASIFITFPFPKANKGPRGFRFTPVLAHFASLTCAPDLTLRTRRSTVCFQTQRS